MFLRVGPSAVDCLRAEQTRPSAFQVRQAATTFGNFPLSLQLVRRIAQAKHCGKPEADEQQDRGAPISTGAFLPIPASAGKLITQPTAPTGLAVTTTPSQTDVGG